MTAGAAQPVGQVVENRVGSDRVAEATGETMQQRLDARLDGWPNLGQRGDRPSRTNRQPFGHGFAEEIGVRHGRSDVPQRMQRGLWSGPIGDRRGRGSQSDPAADVVNRFGSGASCVAGVGSNNPIIRRACSEKDCARVMDEAPAVSAQCARRVSVRNEYPAHRQEPCAGACNTHPKVPVLAGREPNIKAAGVRNGIPAHDMGMDRAQRPPSDGLKCATSRDAHGRLARDLRAFRSDADMTTDGNIGLQVSLQRGQHAGDEIPGNGVVGIQEAEPRRVRRRDPDVARQTGAARVARRKTVIRSSPRARSSATAEVASLWPSSTMHACPSALLWPVRLVSVCAKVLAALCAGMMKAIAAGACVAPPYATPDIPSRVPVSPTEFTDVDAVSSWITQRYHQAPQSR